MIDIDDALKSIGVKAKPGMDEFDTIDMIPQGKKIEDYLPEPKVVIEKIHLINEKIKNNENYL